MKYKSVYPRLPNVHNDFQMGNARHSFQVQKRKMRELKKFRKSIRNKILVGNLDIEKKPLNFVDHELLKEDKTSICPFTSPSKFKSPSVLKEQNRNLQNILKNERDTLKSLQERLNQLQEQNQSLNEKVYKQDTEIETLCDELAKKTVHTQYKRKGCGVVRDKGTLQILGRVRPLIPNDCQEGYSHLTFPENQKTLILTQIQRLSSQCVEKKMIFELDQVFSPKDTNTDIFQKNVADDVSNVLKGGKLTVLAYGHTGSGKTYTMTGSDQEPGILQQSLLKIFNEQSGSPSVEIFFSVLEVYRTKVYDLLLKNRTTLGKKSFASAHRQRVRSPEEVFECIRYAHKLRHVAETSGNTRSSRSHCIYRITTRYRRRGTIFEGIFNMVDLAGSEKPDLTRKDPNLIAETKDINKSLSTLSRVLQSKLRRQVHVPYRDSTLTTLLKRDLSQDDSKMIMIINMSPQTSLLDKTLNSLQFVRSASVSSSLIDPEAMID